MSRPTDGRRFRHPLVHRLLAIGALLLLAAPFGTTAAGAQPVPDPCVQDPASCLPEAPQVPPVDQCVQDPASCLPDPPEVDPCVADPASCVPEPPSVDGCAADPQSCLPESPDLEGCVQKPDGCVPAAGGERDTKPDEGSPHEEGDGDDRGSVTPVRRGDPPRRSKTASQPTDDAGIRATSGGPAPAPSPMAVETAAGEVSPSGLLDRVQRGVTDAARRFAFPMGVAALAGIFLLVQGRLDRRDPKLTAAPIDSRDDVATFR